MAESTEVMEASNSRKYEKRQFTYRLETGKKLIVGVLVVIGIACSWVGSSQFTEDTYTNSFNAPAFMMWFSTAWMSLSYIPVVIYTLLMKRSIMETYRDKQLLFLTRSLLYFLTFRRQWSDQKIFGMHGLCLKTLFGIVAPFCLIWCIANYSYTRALGKVAVTDVTAVFSSCSAFVYIFSLVILKEPFQFLRVLSVMLSISGVVMIAYKDGFKGPSFEGVFLSLISAISAAFYKVMFKRIFGDSSATKVALFLSVLGLFDLLLVWPFFEILYFTKEETISWNDIPWDFLCGRSVLGLVFNFLISFGIAFTFPLFISLGTILGIPINGIVDSIYRNKHMGWFKIIAAVMIILGFLLMLYPGNKTKRPEPTDEDEQNLVT